LWDAGVTFDALSGTSVGALNAALWATGQMEWGNTFWRTIAFNKIYPLRRPALFFFPLALAYAAVRRLTNWIQIHDYLNAFLILCVSLWGPLILAAATWDAVVTLSPTPLVRVNGVIVIECLALFLMLVEKTGATAFTATP
jgi:predicted acylesterase/phospholipase RssA